MVLYLCAFRIDDVKMPAMKHFSAQTASKSPA
jgi:hypothetical protein